MMYDELSVHIKPPLIQVLMSTNCGAPGTAQSSVQTIDE